MNILPVEGKFGYSVGPEMLLTFLQSGVWVRFLVGLRKPTHDSQSPGVVWG